MRKQKLSLEKLKITKLENSYVIKGGLREIGDIRAGGGPSNAISCLQNDDTGAQDS